MKLVLPAALWFFVAAWWFLADAWLLARLGGLAVDLAAAFCVFAALQARAACLPWLVLCAGLARALILGGTACLHVVLLGLPIAALFPMRRLAVPAWLRYACVAGVAALALPGLASLAHRLLDGAPPPLPRPGWSALPWTMLTAPLAARLLGRLPPLWFYREVRA